VATNESKKQAKRKDRLAEEKKVADAQVKVAKEVAQAANIPGANFAEPKAKAKASAVVSTPAVPAVSAAAAVAAKDAAPEPKKEDSVSSNITVPEEKIGRLIGPKGANLKLITEKTGLTRIDTTGNIFTLTGPAKAVEAAEIAVRELVDKGFMSLAYDNFSEAAVQVHPSVFPDLIGKGGVTIRAIKESLGAEISIPQVPPNANKTKKFKVGIAGSAEAVEKAKAVINDIVMYYHHEITHPGQVHEEFEVPDWMYRFIIGSKGSEMRHIQNSYKVRVYIPREHSSNQNVVVVGEKPDVAKAKAYIDKVMWNAEHQPQGGRGREDKA
jgi:rRNA processing protein Krr1/Pno1